MRNAAQRAFDATQHNRHVVVGFFATLAVHQRGAVGAFATDVSGSVGIVTANFSVRGVAVDHRIHIAGGHAKKQVRLA